MSRTTTIFCDVCDSEISTESGFYGVWVQTIGVGLPKHDRHHDVCAECVQLLPAVLRPPGLATAGVRAPHAGPAPDSPDKETT